MTSIDLDTLLMEAVRQQAMRPRRQPRPRRRAATTSEDYANRLAEKALYRRLITESNIAQDGIRFVAYFGSPAHAEGRSLDDWRRLIDKEIEHARNRCALRDLRDDSSSDNETGAEESQELTEELPSTD